MGSEVKVRSTEVLADSPASILDYLARRTSDTVGKQVERSDAIVVGEVEETGGHSVDVKPQDTSTLQEWFSGEAGSTPKIMVFQTRVRVEEWLKGPGNPDVIDLVYVPRSRSHDSEALPLSDVNDRGMLCLRNLPPQSPYVSYLPEQAYQLARGEKGMRTFRDDQAAVNETLAAMRWYLALPPDDTDRRRKALIDALQEGNPQIVHHAIRELAETSAPGAAESFKEMLIAATGELRTELMLGLWVIGERTAALEILDQELSRGKENWLARWELKFSSNETGGRLDTLFGPAASEMAREAN
jgi:hypothetical protein